MSTGQLIILALKLLAFGAALYILRLERFQRRDWQHLAADLAFGLLVFWGYIEVLEAAMGIGFQHSFLHAWSLEAASAIRIRDFLAKHEGLAILAYIAWTTYFNYWSHRIFHKLRPLWELHKVHHSATRMTGVSVFRVHPLEEIIGTYTAPVLITLLLPETGPRFAVYFGFFSMVHNIAVHSEWKASWRWCSWLVTSPAAHQIHHSTNPKHFDSNFGVPLSIWDRLHGTYVDPLKSEAPTRFGVEGMEHRGLVGDIRMLLIDPAVRSIQALAQPVMRLFGRLRSRPAPR